MKYKIEWEKFLFPDEIEEDFEEEVEDEESEYDESSYNTSSGLKISQILSGPENPFAQLKTYNIWTAHCNFKITNEIALLVSDILGVESLDITSPYRMHIAIGKLFNPGETMALIGKEILGHLKCNPNE